MAFSSKKGSFTFPTLSGAYTVGSLGFQPKVVLFWVQEVWQRNGSTNELDRCFGAATSSSAQWCSSNSINIVDATTSMQLMTSAVINGLSPEDASVSFRAAFTAMTSDGFTINVSTPVAGRTLVVHYLAMGGTDLSAAVGIAEVDDTTGSKPFTGVGFQPKALILASGPNSTYQGEYTAQKSTAQVGFATTAAQRSTAFAFDYAAPSVVRSQAITTACVSRINPDGSVVDLATLSSLNADGFTLNFTAKEAQFLNLAYVALGGVAQFAVTTLTEPTVTGSFSTAGLAFSPSCALFASNGFAASTAVRTDSYSSMSAFGDGASMGVAGHYVPNNSTAANRPTSLNSTAYVLGTGYLTEDSAQSAASLVSSNSAGITVNFATVSGSSIVYYGLYAGSGVTSVGVTVTLTGLSATGAVSTATPRGKASAAVTGVEATSGMGTSPQIKLGVTVRPFGVQGEAVLGAPVTQGGSGVALSTLLGTTALGSAAVILGKQVAVAGLQASGLVGFTGANQQNIDVPVEMADAATLALGSVKVRAWGRINQAADGVWRPVDKTRG